MAMEEKTKRAIISQGFTDMGNCFSRRSGTKHFTLTEHNFGSQSLIEIAGTVKIRLLTPQEKENLSQIAIADRKKRLESVNVGDGTSILLSVNIPETEADNIGEYIREVNDSLDDLIKRVS